MKILKRLLVIALNLGLFALLFSTLVHDPYAGPAGDRFIFGEGNADSVTRAELTGLLNRFAEGYAKREVGQAGAFVEGLFVKDEPIVLGTLPTEIFRGGPRVQALIQDDWASWGAVRFQTDRARVSAHGGVAWFALRGQVAFDLSRFLVVPLRLTGTAVRQADGWRFQQVQFQFDVDLSRLLVGNLLLLLWLVVNLGLLGWELWQRFRLGVPEAKTAAHD
jgi:hypothetical protein